ncbi:MAG: hypothetical protein Q9196_006608 [Gyalolechia fulgens]
MCFFPSIPGSCCGTRSYARSALQENEVLIAKSKTVIAGFFTGGSLAIRGGMKAARNSAIGCAILLAVIEGVGIGIQRMMAENTRLDVPPPPPPPAAEGTRPAMIA